MSTKQHLPSSVFGDSQHPIPIDRESWLKMKPATIIGIVTLTVGATGWCVHQTMATASTRKDVDEMKPILKDDHERILRMDAKLDYLISARRTGPLTAQP